MEVRHSAGWIQQSSTSDCEMEVSWLRSYKERCQRIDRVIVGSSQLIQDLISMDVEAFRQECSAPLKSTQVA